jgi:hypothetical protein
VYPSPWLNSTNASCGYSTGFLPQASALSPQAANALNVEKPGIEAEGRISEHNEWIEYIDAAPRKLSEDEFHDLVVGFSSGKQMLLSEITEDVIKRIATPATAYYSTARSDSYYVDGYAFAFEKGQLTRFMVTVHGFPPKSAMAFDKISSQISGRSLSLPCSVDDFEKVFGKANKITRGYYEWPSLPDPHTEQKLCPAEAARLTKIGRTGTPYFSFLLLIIATDGRKENEAIYFTNSSYCLLSCQRSFRMCDNSWGVNHWESGHPGSGIAKRCSHNWR